MSQIHTRKHRTAKGPFSRLSDGERHPVTVTRMEPRVAVVVDLDAQMPVPTVEHSEPSPREREMAFATGAGKGDYAWR